MKSEVLDIMVEITAENSNEILVHEGIKELAIWLPKQHIQIHRNYPIPGVNSITIPEWLAIEKGFI